MDTYFIKEYLLKQKVIQHTCQLSPTNDYSNPSDSTSHQRGCLMYLADSNAIYLLDSPYRGKSQREEIYGLLHAEDEIVQQDTMDDYSSPRYLVRGFLAYAIATQKLGLTIIVDHKNLFEWYDLLQAPDLGNGHDDEQYREILSVEATLFTQYWPHLRPWHSVLGLEDSLLTRTVIYYFEHLISNVLNATWKSDIWDNASVLYTRCEDRPDTYEFAIMIDPYDTPSDTSPIRFDGITAWIIKAIIKQEWKALKLHSSNWECLTAYLRPFSVYGGFRWWCGDMILNTGISNEFEPYIRFREATWEDDTDKGFETSIHSLEELHRLMYETEIANYQHLINLKDIIHEDERHAMLSFVAKFIRYMEMHYPITHRNMSTYRPHQLLSNIAFQVVHHDHHVLPAELDTDYFHQVLDALLAENYIQTDYRCYKWLKTGALYGYFVDIVSHEMHILPSNDRLPWKLFKEVFINATGLYDSAQKALSNKENIRHREKLHILITDLSKKVH